MVRQHVTHCQPILKCCFFPREFGEAEITALSRTSGLTGQGWGFRTSPGWQRRSAAAGSRPDAPARLRFGSALRSGSVLSWQLTFLQRQKALTHRDRDRGALYPSSHRRIDVKSQQHCWFSGQLELGKNEVSGSSPTYTAEWHLDSLNHRQALWA